jgi:hypothetical protein
MKKNHYRPRHRWGRISNESKECGLDELLGPALLIDQLNQIKASQNYVFIGDIRKYSRTPTF